ncbi:hypothetical protein GA0115259_115823, partial [Streptomyces sp. MnatMP-M17]
MTARRRPRRGRLGDPDPALAAAIAAA